MRTTIRIAIIAAVVAIGAGAATAQHRGYARQGEGFVTAESRFGHGTVSGPVRVASKGNYEVRLPGGTWISCGRNCAETLRVESVDFWENRGGGRNRIDNECGLFGCLSRGFRF